METNLNISREQADHIAHWACLHLSEIGLAKFRKDLSVILNYVRQLSQVDTSTVEIEQPAIECSNYFGEDIVELSLPKAKALKNCPLCKGGMFSVPKVI